MSEEKPSDAPEAAAPAEDAPEAAEAAEAPAAEPAEGEAEEAKAEEEEKLDDEEVARRANRKAVDQFYPDDYSAKDLEDSKISKRNFAFHGVLGIPSMKRYNIHFLSAQEIIFVSGNKYQTYNLQTQKKTTYHGRDRDGVGSIAVHPKQKFFAVAEKGSYPNIYIYSYPELKLYRILTRGTETRYAHVEFS